MFQSPLPPEPVKGDWPSQPPPAPRAQPGAFTQMFQQSPVIPEKQPEPAPDDEFSRFFDPQKPAPPAAPSPFPGGFPQSAPPQPKPPSQPGGGV